MVVVFHDRGQLNQELLVDCVDGLEVGEEQDVHLLVLDDLEGGLHHLLDDEGQVGAVSLFGAEQLVGDLDSVLHLLDALF